MKAIALSALILSAFAFVSSESYDDAVEEQNHYCEMVASGAWPNYKNLNCGNNDE